MRIHMSIIRMSTLDRFVSANANPTSEAQSVSRLLSYNLENQFYTCIYHRIYPDIRHISLVDGRSLCLIDNKRKMQEFLKSSEER